jgi:cobalt-zinc-cadmium efflux system membrane fusion protein
MKRFPPPPRLRWASVLIGLFSLGVSGCSACRRDADPAHTPSTDASPPAGAAAEAEPGTVKVDPSMLRDLRITTTTVESRRGGEMTTLLGELAVDQRAYAEVGAPAAARAVRLVASPGDAVRAGQLLAELSSPDLARARADHTSAEARVALAERALARKRDLAAEKIVPLREVQEAEAELANAQSARRSAAATLAAFGIPPSSAASDASDPSRFGLLSPIAGTVLERSASLGQMVDPAVPVFRIANLSTLWLTVHAFERDAVRITSGTPARLSFPALPGQEFRGTVTLVGREVSKESRTVPVRIEIRNQNGVLRPGMSASAAVPVNVSEGIVLSVPVAAVQRVRNEWCVFIPKETGAYEIRKIGRGRDLGTEVEVLSGLKAGETIVVDGAFLLKSQAEKGEAGHGHGGRP